MNNFNLKKFLTENKLTTASKLNEQADNLFTFGFDMDAIEDVVDYLEAKYKEGQDYQLHIGRGDDTPNAVTLLTPAVSQDTELSALLDNAKDTEEDADSLEEGKTGELFTFGFDMAAIEDVVDYLEAKYTQGPDYQFHIGRGDDMPNAVTLKSPEAGQDAKLLALLDDAKDTEEDADSI